MDMLFYLSQAVCGVVYPAYREQIYKTDLKESDAHYIAKARRINYLATIPRMMRPPQQQIDESRT